MSENQKLRDALSELIEAYNRAGPELSRAERAVDRMRLIAAHEALALPTAAPVGEREAFEELIEEFEAAAIDKHDCRNPEYQFEHRAYDAACQRYDAARAALSAGDAGWQPIETAPKDGSDCWLLVEEEVRRGFWVEIEFEERRDLDGRYIDQTDDDAYWMDKDSGDSLEPTMFYPITKPLPPAPAMRKGQL